MDSQYDSEDQSPPTTSSFTAINQNGPLFFSPYHGKPSSIGPPALSTQTRRSALKRVASADSGHSSKRQLLLPAIPSPSPFRTLKVSKSGRISHSPYSKEYSANQYIRQSVQEDYSSSPEKLMQETTMIRLSYPSHILQDNRAGNGYKGTDFRSSSTQPGFEEPELIQDVDLLDEYPLGNHEEEDMARLLEETQVSRTHGIPPSSTMDKGPEAPGYENDTPSSSVVDQMPKCNVINIPPSSVADAWDRDSRSANEYDPSLQFSSRQSSTLATSATVVQEDLLDDDVDWDAVFAITSTIPKDASLVGSREAEKNQERPKSVEEEEEKVSAKSADVANDSTGPLKAFTRDPFPETVRDRSLVPGLSSNIVLRTCFRIGDMVSQTARCYNHQQEAVFELYARVSYSSRESLARKQHFQFVDLFKDQQPYPSAVLSGWRIGSLLDRQSQVFVNTSSPKLCWCLCKPKKEPKVVTGWMYEIMGIRETDWAQIRFAKNISCGETEEIDASVATLKL